MITVAADDRRKSMSVDQEQEATPRWAAPALVAVLVLAALSYAWGFAQLHPEPYYAAAVRSMAMSWHNLFFAAFDPSATVSIDKLPGAFWLQALSVKIFGPQVWALVLPQVIEGVLTILVLHRAVRKVSGHGAALIAAVVAACVPATVALNRGNIADTLLILLLVLAANATVSAVQTAKPRHLMLAGLFVGLAFQAKMAQAWLVLPAIALAWLIVTPKGAWRIRLAWTVGMGVVAAAVSLSWMLIVSAVPAGSRPYVDGSHGNSLFDQVFRYNATSRGTDTFDVGAANLQLGGGKSVRSLTTLGAGNHLDHVFSGAGGRAIGWLIPLALVCLIGLAVVARKRASRTEAAVLAMWGGWLTIHIVVFLVVGTVNPYYLAALMPPTAALVAMGTVELARAGSDSRVRAVALGAGVLTIAYACVLLGPAPGVVRGTILGVAAACVVGAVVLRGVGSAAALLIGVLAAPAVASVWLVTGGYGAFDTPFEQPDVRSITTQFMSSGSDTAGRLVDSMRDQQRPGDYPFATFTSIVASPFIFATGAEILPIGGFTGNAPVPSVDQLASIVAAGKVHLVLVLPVADARMDWVRSHCHPLPPKGSIGGILPYYCGKLPAK